jgi:hypothetical protein
MPSRTNPELKFDTFGPFQLPRLKFRNGIKARKNKKRIDQDNDSRKFFWRRINDEHRGLSGAVGCYVFALGKIPWYVGKTEKLRFGMETWQPHKIEHYENALRAKSRAKPVLYLIAKRTPSGRFSKASSRGHRDIRLLETLMIGAALQRNGQLFKQTRYEVTSNDSRARIH